jgi:hypothetical protein
MALLMPYPLRRSMNNRTRNMAYILHHGRIQVRDQSRIIGKYVFTFLLIIVLSFCAQSLKAQAQNSKSSKEYKHSLDFCPVSPLFKIYAIHYCRRITPTSEIIVAPYYANIHYENIGNTDAPGFIIGYRRFLWKTLHIDYQLMPQWDYF